MSDLANPGSDDPLAPTSSFSDSPPERPANRGNAGGFHNAGSANAARFGQELHSITIRAKQRTFYFDLKQSSQGKFLKLSEKSRGGQKSTVIFDGEDLPKFIQALQEMQSKM